MLQTILVAYAALAAGQAAVPAAPPSAPIAAAGDEAGPGAEAEPKRRKGTAPSALRNASRKFPRAAILTNPREIASHQDYPKEALQKEMQGTARARLLIDAEGRVSRCTVDQSSGHELLDSQTCDLFTAHALFEPGRDRRGKAVPSQVYHRLTWRLETSTFVPANFISRTTTVIGPAGELRSCKIEMLVDREWRETPAGPCDQTGKLPAAYWLMLRERSKVHDAVVVAETWVLTDPAESMPNVGAGTGQVLIGLRSARMSYAQDGKRTSCTMLGHVGMSGYRDDVCTETGEWAIKPPPQLLAKGGLPNVRFMTAVYLAGEPD